MAARIGAIAATVAVQVESPDPAACTLVLAWRSDLDPHLTGFSVNELIFERTEMTRSEILTFPVRRHLLSALGWLFIVFGVGAFLVVFLGDQYHPPWRLFGIICCPPIGVLMLRAVRNVREIRLDGDRLVFHPVGAELTLSDIKSISEPDRAGPLGALFRMMGILPVKTHSGTTRLVLGAVIQGAGECRIYVYGSDTDRLIRVLRDRIAAQAPGPAHPSDD